MYLYLLLDSNQLSIKVNSKLLYNLVNIILVSSKTNYISQINTSRVKNIS